MNEESSNNFVKTESLLIGNELDLQNCIEEFELYQFPEQFNFSSIVQDSMGNNDRR
jgi:hypothetical protein